MRTLTISLIAAACISGVATAQEKGTPVPVASDAQPDGTVTLSGGSVAAGIGYTWGHGKLTYQGKPHKFTISGLSIVDAGAANLSSTGTVYNMKSLADFAGDYAAVTAGVTIAGGGSASYLKNEHGVVIKLISTSVGLKFNLSADGVKVKLKS